jgi:amino acid adenylation domain-containing protein
MTKNVEDIYPLSPLQEGILFHTLLAPRSGAYVVHLSFRIEGHVDVPAFKQAWQIVVERHPVLRSAFVWERVEKPLQAVRRQVAVAWDERDWSQLTQPEQDQHYQEYMAEEHRRGFNPAHAPLLRMGLIRLSAESCQFIFHYSHLLLDGWSVGIVFRELAACYRACAEHRAPDLPQPRPYRDFIAWLQQQNKTEAEAFWRNTLQGFSEPTPLGLEELRQGRETSDDAVNLERSSFLSHGITEKLQGYARQQRVTVSTLVQGTWAWLLSAYSRTDDVVAGVTVSGRPVSLKGADAMVGVFANTLPLRIAVRHEAPLGEWLREIQRRQSEMSRYEFSSLIDVKSWSEVPVSLPLFESFVVFENAPVAHDAQELHKNVQFLSSRVFGTANYPLALRVEPGERLLLRVMFDSSRFSAETASAVLHHVELLLTALAERSPQRVGELSLLTLQERRQVLAAWNQTARPYDRRTTVISLLEQQVERTPHAVAVQDETRTLTYSELNRQANQLAHYLRSLHVGPEVPVGIHLSRSLNMLAAVLAVLKAGAAYVPLDPDYPAERLAFIMHDMQSSVVLTEAGLTARLPQSAARLVSMDENADWRKTIVEARGNPIEPVEPENAAYVIYTSGSTGTPKGVVVSHGSLLNYLLWVKDTLLRDGQNIPAITSLAFDASLKQIFGPLLSGGTVYMIGDFVRSPGALMQLLANGPTVLNCVPSVWRHILEETERDPRWNASGLVHLLLGGESAPAELLARTQSAFPGLRISNLYGPTETTANATYAAEISAEHITIGTPVANTRAYVLDRNWHPVPAGIPGELLIGGDGVARGYHRQPALTAEKFLPDPFSEAEGTRLYRTGDLVRWLPNGELEFLGRVDHQVKVRGYRIELGEIEAALARFPELKQSVVMVHESAAAERQLVAYVVPQPGAAFTSAEARIELARRLPDYMVPASFVVLRELPLMPNGKIDRRALPAPERESASHRRPGTPQEEMLCEIFAGVLGVESFGADEDFFHAGGHSLLAMRLVSRIRGTFGVELPLAALFESPTVAQLAGQLAPPEKTRPLLMAQPRPARLPLSHSQRRLWFIDQLEGGSPQYNISEALTLRGPVDLPALQQTVNALVARHESLRTCFVPAEAGPQQMILPALDVPIAVEDLSAQGGEGQRRRIVDILREERDSAFDLSRGPLLRVRLLQLRSDEHILVRTVHHIACDGWSVGVLNREFAVLYQAFRTGQRNPLPPLPLQYADFSVWQQSWLNEDRITRELQYWKIRLAGAPPELELPRDRARGPRQTFAADVCHATIPAAQVSALRQLGYANRSTLFMSLLAVFAMLLERYTGQQDMVIGSPVANRPDALLEGLVGFFVNSLALRVPVDTDKTFRQLLAEVRAIALESYQHQDVPFERLVEEIAPQRSLNRTPIFQVVFALQNAAGENRQYPGLEVAEVTNRELRVRHDLEVHARESAGEVELYWTYNRDLFDRWRIEQMARHFVRLLNAALATPEVPVHHLDMMSAEERSLVLESFHVTARPLPDFTVAAMFEAQVEKTPEATALEFGDHQLSYADLNARANQLAYELMRSGVAPETLVGIALDRSLEMMVALVAIVKAGGAYVPIATDLPWQRRQNLVADAGLRHFIVLSRDSHEYAALVPHVIALDNIAGNNEQPQQSSNPKVKLSPAHALYVNYTSGSTGQPKGVLVCHASVKRLVWQPNFIQLDASSRLLQMAPLSFDAATLEIWGALLNGGSLVIMPPGPSSVEEIAAVMTRHKVNTLWLTAGLFRQVVETALPSLAGLKYLLAGGDVLPPDHVRRVQQAHPHCCLINGYGPTENTTFTCCYPIPPDAELARGVPIGFPVWNTRVYVLDRHMQPVPPGVAGELYTSGAGLARGYLNASASTAERFVAAPYALNPGERMYRTGDLVRWTPEGTLEFIGRADRQVKIRGFRVEPGEVEAVLGHAPNVSQCAVIAHAGPGADKRLIAYVVPSGGHAPDPAELRSFLKDRLPGYMTPSDFVLIESLPLTANGKLDRAALPLPAHSANRDDYRAPRTPEEEILCELFVEVLGVERVGIDDNFFESGGHSLMASLLVSRVRKTMSVELPLRRLFEAPTVAELATHLHQTAGMRPALTRQARPALLPLSYPQQRLWFIDQLQKTSTEYNIPGALRLRGPLDLPALEKAMNTIVERHESLRTTFMETGGQPFQIVMPQLLVEVPLKDLSDTEPDAQQQQVIAAMRAEREQPFDLQRGPLLRASVIRLQQHEHVLLLTFHHIVFDGWSHGVFSRELVTLYESFHQQRPSPLPPLPVQYADFAIWQRGWLNQEMIERELRYWRAQLADIPEQLGLPQDRPRQMRQTFAGDVCSHTINAGQLQAIRRLAQSADATLYMTLLGAFAVLLERYSGQRDVIVGSPVANRHDPLLEPLIGFFVNSLVLRIRLAPQATFRELLAQVRATSLEAFQHQDLPFERLVEELSPRRSLNTPPVFQVLFAVQNSPVDPVQLHDLLLEPMTADQFHVRHDLELHVRERNGELDLHWMYNRDLFDRWRIEQMARHFARLLEHAVTGAEKSLSHLELLSTEEYQQIMSGWNQTAREYPPHSLQELLERQAQLSPQREAIVCGGNSLTYAELNQRANQLAHYLRGLGVGPEIRVGICLQRGLDLIVSLLAVLKAGGAYVPLDPNYPAERLAYTLHDAQAPVLLTQRSLAAQIPPYSGRLIEVDADWQKIAAESYANPPVLTHPENLAYVIYTSGSTGKPKGVAIRHSSVTVLLHWAREVFSPEDFSGMLASTSICFDLSIFEIFVPLCFGGTVFVVANALELETMAGAERVRLLNTVPSAMRELVRTGAVPESVRTVNLAGEVLPRELVHQVYETTGVERVFNLYGPSEDTTYSTCALLQSGSTNRTVSIGSPVANTQAYILNEWMQPVPLGVTGELYLGGDKLARGYLGRSEMTAEKFVPDPFSQQAGGRLYRTGDLARYAPDGNLEFLGRSDQQVKIRGFRIEPGEVESVLARYHNVEQAAVIVREDRPGEKRLVAYLVAAPDCKVDLDEARQSLRRQLPEFMVPSALVLLPALPFTPNGKLDKNALPVPETVVTNDREVLPLTELEQTIARAWQEVLEVEKIGVHDNFFDRGGHSLLARLLQSKLSAALEREIELVQIFQFPTIASFARSLEDGPAVTEEPRGGQERLSQQKKAIEKIKKARSV